MLTMVMIASAGLMFTMFLMRRTSARARRADRDGIRWRGINWSAKPEEEEESHSRE